MLAALKPRVTKIYCAQAPHPSAMDPLVLAEQADAIGLPAESIPNTGDAIKLAIQESDPDHVVLVTGSIFIVASARIAWFERSDLE